MDVLAFLTKQVVSRRKSSFDKANTFIPEGVNKAAIPDNISLSITPHSSHGLRISRWNRTVGTGACLKIGLCSETIFDQLASQ
jgi:hypothetical protein